MSHSHGLPRSDYGKLVARELKILVPARYGSEKIRWLIDKVSDNIDAAARKSGLMVYRFGTRIFFNVFNLVPAPILVFFMLHYKKNYHPDDRFVDTGAHPRYR